MVRQNSVVLVQDLNYKNINLNSIYNDFISYLYLFYLKKLFNYKFNNKFYEKENVKLQQVGGGKILKKIFKILKKTEEESFEVQLQKMIESGEIKTSEAIMKMKN